MSGPGVAETKAARDVRAHPPERRPAGLKIVDGRYVRPLWAAGAADDDEIRRCASCRSWFGPTLIAGYATSVGERDVCHFCRAPFGVEGGVLCTMPLTPHTGRRV